MKLKIVRKKIDTDTMHLTLTGDVTVYSVVKLKEIIINELKSCSGITMDLAGIGEADTSGFQLFLFLKREAELAGKSFKITEAGPRLKTIFALYRETI